MAKKVRTDAVKKVVTDIKESNKETSIRQAWQARVGKNSEPTWQETCLIVKALCGW